MEVRVFLTASFMDPSVMGSPVGEAFGLGNNLVVRSVLEIRRRAPVMLHHDSRYALVFASELLEEHSLTALSSLSDRMYLLLTANRTEFISGRRVLSRTPVAGLTLAEIHAFLTACPSALPKTQIVDSANPLDDYAIDLMKLATVLPSALIVDMDFTDDEAMKLWCTQNNILSLSYTTFCGYHEGYSLHEVCRSDLFLHDHIASKILVYRSNMVEPEHYAIIVGNPDFRNPTVRLHSSCYTGDLLGSLACDCRGQLLLAVQLLGSTDGGVILYISQEGRGIGIANKIRTYNLQGQGLFDTVDANRFLGFNDDERVFLPAASILKALGITEFKMLTSNPSKVLGMRQHGFNVTEMVPLSVEANPHNSSYLKTKRKRLGHVDCG
ncbi:MAG: GTP cyclohydrolase II [Anaplasma sp.]